MQLSYTVLIAQILNFLIIFFIFKFFVANKLYAIVQERRKLIAKLKQAEAEKQRILDEAAVERKEIMDAVKKEAKAYMKTSQNLAKEKGDAIIKDANASVKRILQSGDRQLEKERTQMLAETKDYIIDMAIKLNQRVFKSANVNREFMELELEKIK